MTIEEIIQKILAKHPEISEPQLLQKMQAEKTRSGGLLSDETLLRLIAAKLGIDIPNNIVYQENLSTSRLLAGLNDVTVAGRLLTFTPAKTFQGEKSGKYATLTVADNDGVIRVVLWNEKADLVEKGELKAGQIIRLIHGYTREDRSGKTELHLGQRSQIVIEPESKLSEYPSIGRFTIKIASLVEDQTVNVEGIVSSTPENKEVKTSKGETVKLMTFGLKDDSGNVRVSVWRQHAEALANLKLGDKLLLENVYVKKGFSGEKELSTRATTVALLTSA